MLNVNALKAEWVKKGLTQQDVAHMVGISTKTLSLQLKRGILGSDTIEILIKELEIKNPVEIFFAQR